MDNLKQHIQNNLTGLDIENPRAEFWNEINDNLQMPDHADFIKNYLQNNELELEMPKEFAWKNIENNLVTSKKTVSPIKLKQLFYYAAAACVLLLIGLNLNKSIKVIEGVNQPEIVVNNVDLPKNIAPEIITVEPKQKMDIVEKKLNKNVVVVNKKVKANLNVLNKQQLPTQVMQIDADFANLIAGQVSRIQGMAIYGESPDYFDGFIHDFKMLDVQEKELRKTLMQQGLQDNNIDELVSIYQQKLMILKKLQTEINKTSNRSKRLTDTLPVFIKI